MKWIFKGKFSERVGMDYIYECSNCGYVIKIENINGEKKKKTKNIDAHPNLPKDEDGQRYCPKCKEIEDWRKR